MHTTPDMTKNMCMARKSSARQYKAPTKAEMPAKTNNKDALICLLCLSRIVN